MFLQAHVRNKGPAKPTRTQHSNQPTNQPTKQTNKQANKQTNKQKKKRTVQRGRSYPKTMPISSAVRHRQWKRGETSSRVQYPLSSAPRRDSIAPLTNVGLNRPSKCNKQQEHEEQNKTSTRSRTRMRTQNQTRSTNTNSNSNTNPNPNTLRCGIDKEKLSSSCLMVWMKMIFQDLPWERAFDANATRGKSLKWFSSSTSKHQWTRSHGFTALFGLIRTGRELQRNLCKTDFFNSLQAG